MGSKSIIVLGMLVSLGFIYTCIEDKKEEVFKAVELINPQAENTLEAQQNQPEQEEEILASIEEITKPSQNTTKESQEVVAKVQEPKSTLQEPLAKEEQKISQGLASLEGMEEEPTEPVVTLQKSDPAFGMMFEETTKVVGMFEEASKNGALINFIEKFCQDTPCSNDLRFSQDIKHVEWEKELIALVQFMQENHIPHGSFFINTNLLSIEGEIEGEGQQKRLQTIIRHLEAKGLGVEDKTVKKEKVVLQPEPLPTTQTDKQLPVVPEIATNPAPAKSQTPPVPAAKEPISLPKSLIVTKPKKETPVKVASTQPLNTKRTLLPKAKDQSAVEAKINALLRQSPIVFTANNNQISPESQKVLDEIAALLQSTEVGKIEIAAYEAQKLDPIFSKVISQKRADTVQRYLQQKGLRGIYAKGYGESGFLSSLDPKDPKNERIEIYLKRGE